MSEAPKTFRELLAELGGAMPAEDVVHAIAPLMRAVGELHARDMVAALRPDGILVSDDRALSLRQTEGVAPRFNEAELRALQPHAGSALRIVGEYRITTDTEEGQYVDDLRVASSADTTERTKPAFLLDYACWEHRIGHHDSVADVYVAGLILASLACGLDLSDDVDLNRFVQNRENLFRLNAALHPAIAQLIAEMTPLNRHERATDMMALANRLENYRDQPVSADVERVLAEVTGVAGRRRAVLTHLRDRLFDLSRRNKLIHFRPTEASVNLTVASVPLVMQLQSIRAEQLCVWGGPFASDVLSGQPASLVKWLRFEDQPYLPSAFDRILQSTRRDRAEYGFSHLRLVIAFLRWNNLKEAPDERIVSPLLWLPVELTKKKGVRDQYVLRCTTTDAEFNPALRYYLRQIYDIQLPETISLADATLEDVRADIAAQIAQTEPSVTLTLKTAPEIELIHDKAVQRMRRFQRRQRFSTQGYTRPDYSYEKDDYRPLGLALFEKYVRPSPLPQRMAAGAPPAPRPQRMNENAAPDEKLGYALADGKGNRYAWDIDLTQVTLANLNYRKMSLIQDYTQLLDGGAPAPSFERVFSIEPRPIDEAPPPPLPAQENWSVVPADATQEAAVSLARDERSFIIQGPPGTGKSQTITNLIADYVARGKRVLFVCEKRAALDVVFSRLRLSGLDRLACLIHDSQEDKKAFVQDLKLCYESWSQNDDGAAESTARRAEIVAALEHHVGKIAAFEQGMTHVHAPAGIALRAQTRRLAAAPDVDDLNNAVRERLPDLAAWDRQASLTGRVYDVVHNLFGLESLAEHAFSRLAPEIVASDQSFARTEALIAGAQSMFNALDESFEDESSLLSGELSLAQAAELTEAAAEAVATGLAANFDLLDPNSAASAAFAELNAARAQAVAKAEFAAETARGWTDALSPQDAQAALDQARRQQTSLLRFIDPAWWRLRSAVRARYRFAEHAVEPSLAQALEWLIAKQKADIGVQDAAAALNARFNCTDAAKLADARERWMTHASPMAVRLRQRAQERGSDARVVAREAGAAENVARLAALLRQGLVGADDMSLDRMAEMLRDMQESLEDLPELSPHLRDLDAADAKVAHAMRTLPLDREHLDAAIVSETLARTLRITPELVGFDVAALSGTARKAASARRLLLESNAISVSAACQSRFRDHLKRSTVSVSELDAAGRAFKKTYSTGRRELEREFAKTMRYRSIRDLANEETGAVVNDLKPVWLMSPLSVSDTLPLRHDLFDVVIFDEASQIPMEEAVPALSRAAQVIVVGDEMQLPPTSFFSTAREDDEATVTAADEDGDAIAILLDADSLLNQSARTLPATMLAWHYRSRYEALINFSNAAFYDGRLVTVPDRVLPKQEAGAAQALRSTDPEAARTAVSHLLQRPISFHSVADGLYEARANTPEAKLIAQMVREIFQRDTKLSIGIVAFSEAQQSEIERALDALADEDKAFGVRLDQEYEREDEGQINDLFVKNLENVQGDERDIILMSVCYAPDKNGRMAMNFGPINQRGGEKRLNVIFSRARHHMAIVSTIRGSAITNTHNDGARALASFLSFAEAQAQGEVTNAQAILATLNPDARRVFAAAPPRDAIRDAIAAALRERGHDVREHVGSSGFRCDLAIAGPNGDAHALGILIDADATTGVYDRYVFQPTILRAFGWRVIDIPAHAWLRDSELVLDEIERALLGQQNASDDDPFDHAVAKAPRAKSKKSAEQKEAAPAPAAAAPSAALSFTELRFEEGASSKFWKVAVSGVELTVVFGRIGAKGSTVLKTFPTPDRAERERTKLIAEKLAKGYREI